MSLQMVCNAIRRHYYPHPSSSESLWGPIYSDIERKMTLHFFSFTTPSANMLEYEVEIAHIKYSVALLFLTSLILPRLLTGSPPLLFF